MQELFHEILTKENLSPYNTLTELINGAGMYIYSVVPKGLDLSESLANNFVAYLLSYKYPTEDKIPTNITTVDEYLLWRWVNKYYKTSNIQNITKPNIYYNDGHLSLSGNFNNDEIKVILKQYNSLKYKVGGKYLLYAEINPKTKELIPTYVEKEVI